MGKTDLLKDSMKCVDGLLPLTAKSRMEKPTVPVSGKKEPAVHCNFVIDKSIHTRMKYLPSKRACR